MTATTADGRRIATSYARLSPHPALDWCAYVDGTEETGVRGWGETEAEAVADLLVELDT